MPYPGTEASEPSGRSGIADVAELPYLLGALSRDGAIGGSEGGPMMV
jgi:hypothetical protein